MTEKIWARIYRNKQVWTKTNENKQEYTRIAVILPYISEKNLQRRNLSGHEDAPSRSSSSITVYCTCYSYSLVEFKRTPVNPRVSPRETWFPSPPAILPRSSAVSLPWSNGVLPRNSPLAAVAVRPDTCRFTARRARRAPAVPSGAAVCCPR